MCPLARRPRSVRTTRTASRRLRSSEVQASIRVDVEVFTIQEAKPVTAQFRGRWKLGEQPHHPGSADATVDPGSAGAARIGLTGCAPSATVVDVGHLDVAGISYSLADGR